MTRRRLIAGALAGCVALGVLTLDASAHKLQFSMSELVYRPDARRLEVAHSIHLDDAMALLATVGDRDGDLSVETQARLLLYVERHFSLWRGGERLSLDPVGAALDGDYLWIYQELESAPFPSDLEVKCSLLHDLNPRQQNQVNLVLGDVVRTLRFDRDHQVAHLL